MSKKKVKVGNLTLGGEHIYIQSMLNIPADDVEGNVRQAAIPQPKEATVLTLCTTPIGPDISLRPYVPLSRLPNEIHISLPYETKLAHAACITFTKLCLSP